MNIVTTPQNYADAVNSVVDNYMYWQLINNSLAILFVILLLGIVGWTVWRYLW